jgi:CheY-like chemotaxis protein
MRSCLLIDPDPDDQDYFISVLHEISSQAGCYAVSNGEEAFLALLSNDFIPDYIVTEVEMPVMNGMEFLERVKKVRDFQNIPVIVMTQSCSNEMRKQLESLGAVAVYSKTRTKTLKEILKKYF